MRAPENEQAILHSLIRKRGLSTAGCVVHLRSDDPDDQRRFVELPDSFRDILRPEVVDDIVAEFDRLRLAAGKHIFRCQHGEADFGRRVIRLRT